jgi:hypothetical protein
MVTGSRGFEKAGHWVARDGGNCEQKIAAHDREMKHRKRSYANQKFMTLEIRRGTAGRSVRDQFR